MIEKSALATASQAKAEGMGLEPTTPVKGHLISSEAASHSLTLPMECRGAETMRLIPGRLTGPEVSAIDPGPSVDDLGSANEVNEFLVRAELAQLGGQLLHRVDVVHGRERAS